MTDISRERARFLASILQNILTMDAKGIPSNADSASNTSVTLARALYLELKGSVNATRLAGQTSGKKFETAVAAFVKSAFGSLSNLRPGEWIVEAVGGKNRELISSFEQYSHLVALAKAAKENRELAAALGSDYTITPDVIVARKPESDHRINTPNKIVDKKSALLTPLRASNNQTLILHASISCKWTLRSDRAQNARSEALNLVKNRKGRLPHVMVVTGEPTPGRLASIALGTGEIDCVYHFALTELQNAVSDVGGAESKELLALMVEGRRLRDIADLVLDLAI